MNSENVGNQKSRKPKNRKSKNVGNQKKEEIRKKSRKSKKVGNQKIVVIIKMENLKKVENQTNYEIRKGRKSVKVGSCKK